MVGATPAPRLRPVSVISSVIVLAVGSVLQLFWFFGVEVATEPLEPPPGSAPFIVLEEAGEAPSSRLERELALLADPAPLFIPTDWNFVVRAQQGGYQAPETPDLFSDFGARILLDGNRPLKASWSGQEIRFARPEDGLVHEEWQVFAGFGEVGDGETVALPARLAAFRVVRIGGAGTALSGEISNAEVRSIPPEVWRPLTVLIMVGEFGLSGLPLAIAGSGDENWNDTLNQWVLESRHWAGLDPGLYQLTIGP